MFWCTKSVKFHCQWGTKPQDQKQETGNDCDVISGLQASPTFSHFLISNAPLYHFLANWLAHNKKMTAKSVFCKAWSPEMTSQSFPVSCFWSCGFAPHQKWNLMLLVHQNTGRENRYQKFFFGIHISAGDLIEQIKICSIVFTFWCLLVLSCIISVRPKKRLLHHNYPQGT